MVYVVTSLCLCSCYWGPEWLWIMLVCNRNVNWWVLPLTPRRSTRSRCNGGKGKGMALWEGARLFWGQDRVTRTQGKAGEGVVGVSCVPFYPIWTLESGQSYAHIMYLQSWVLLCLHACIKLRDLSCLNVPCISFSTTMESMTFLPCVHVHVCMHVCLCLCVWMVRMQQQACLLLLIAVDSSYLFIWGVLRQRQCLRHHLLAHEVSIIIVNATLNHAQLWVGGGGITWSDLL